MTKRYFHFLCKGIFLMLFSCSVYCQESDKSSFQEIFSAIQKNPNVSNVSVKAEKSDTCTIISCTFFFMGANEKCRLFVTKSDTTCSIKDKLLFEFISNSLLDSVKLNEAIFSIERIKNISFETQYTGKYDDLMVGSNNSFIIHWNVFNVDFITYNDFELISFHSSKSEIEKICLQKGLRMYYTFCSRYNLVNNYPFEQFRYVYISTDTYKIVGDQIISMFNSEIKH